MAAVPAHGPATTLVMRIRGVDMPGLSCAPHDARQRYSNVHVGVPRDQEVVDRYPGDAPNPEWSFEVRIKHLDEGPDFGGPFVHGRRGDRFVYLSWGALEGHEFIMFRRAKLHFADAPRDVLAAAVETGTLSCRVRMTDSCGNPRCARVRPPDAEWTSPGYVGGGRTAGSEEA